MEIAGPGFINFFLNPRCWYGVLDEVMRAGQGYGRSHGGAGRKVQVEFVSANPTGPLHIGHGRGAAVGDTLCRLLDASGWEVTREFYYNDAGRRSPTWLSRSRPAASASSPTIRAGRPTATRGTTSARSPAAYLAGGDRRCRATGTSPPPAIPRTWRRSAASPSPTCAGNRTRIWPPSTSASMSIPSSRASMPRTGSTRWWRQLTANGFTYEADGALWLRTTDFGDDKDRVMRKADGSYTYFVPDVAYHLAKWQRGFVRVINEQGADHHSTITRVRAGLQALQAGIPQGWPEYLLHQMVTVLRGGQEVKISKRAGSYVTLRDLIDEVGTRRHPLLLPDAPGRRATGLRHRSRQAAEQR